MTIKRPKRDSYPSEPDFLIACLRYLDAKHPGREGQRRRVAAWKRWSEQPDTDALRDEIRDLVMLDRSLTEAEEVALLELVAAWHRTKHRTTTTETESTK